MMEYVVTTAVHSDASSGSRAAGKLVIWCRGPDSGCPDLCLLLCDFATHNIIIRVDSKRRTPPNLSLLSGFRLLFTLHPPPQKAILSCSISTFRSSSILSTSYFI